MKLPLSQDNENDSRRYKNNNIPSIDLLLKLHHCSILKSAHNSWETENSAVLSSPAICLPTVFNMPCQINAAVNFVSIKGRSGEPVHYHTSHLVGLVVNGSGWLLTPTEDDATATVVRQLISVGDVIVIPSGVYHIFECDPASELDYIALEFSDRQIDYQKHWKD